MSAHTPAHARGSVGSVIVDSPTSAGLGRLVVDAADAPVAALWLGHGAGGGIDAVDLAALARALPALGVTVLRFEQPWRVAGRRVAARPPVLDAAWVDTVPLVAEIVGELPLFAGGRSAGARVACRTAASAGAAGVVALAFPLHPPGRPEKSRLEELLTPSVPVLVLQGTRDTFGTAGTISAEAEGHPDVRVVAVEGADHGMKVLKAGPLTPRQVADQVTGSVREFIRSVVGS